MPGGKRIRLVIDPQIKLGRGRILSPAIAIAARAIATGATKNGPRSTAVRGDVRFGSRLCGPIDHRIDKGLGLTDRIAPGGPNADRDRPAFSHGPFPTAGETHFDNRESDATMFHG